MNLKKPTSPLASILPLLGIVLAFGHAQAQGMPSVAVEMDLAKLPAQPDAWDKAWSTAPEQTVTLMFQPIAIPMPTEINTPLLRVRSIHSQTWIAFRLEWTDEERSEAGRLGQFSDAAALMFPVKNNAVPPPIFMGAKDDPVHIFHWRAQYQVDKERGMREMRDLYPNMNPDMYPMEFKDEGHLTGLTNDNREVFSHGRAAGNPQSYAKKGIDEIFAEGFGTSAVIQNIEAIAQGWWRDNTWTLVIARPLKREHGSVLNVGETSHVAFAVWQGGKDEVGSRKSITMVWTPLEILPPGGSAP